MKLLLTDLFISHGGRQEPQQRVCVCVSVEGWGLGGDILFVQMHN